MRGESRCRWIRYPWNGNAPSANEFLLWWFIPGNWAGQKCSHETLFLEPGLFCWNRAKHGWLSPCLRKRAWGNPPVLLADLFQDRRNTVCTSLWLPSGCTWWICPKARGAGSSAAARWSWQALTCISLGGCSRVWGASGFLEIALFSKNWKKFLFNLDQNQILCIYIYIFKPLHFQGTGNTAFQPALLDSFIGLCHNKSEVRRNRKALLSNNRGWGSGKGGLNQRQACWVTVLPAEHKIHVPEAWSKSRGYKALHLTAPQSRTNQGASLESEVLCPEQSLVSSDGRTLDYFSGISEQMLLASYGCLPTYGALLCHQTLPKIQSSFWQQRTVFIYHENWSGLGSQFCKLFISCQ